MLIPQTSLQTIQPSCLVNLRYFNCTYLRFILLLLVSIQSDLSNYPMTDKAKNNKFASIKQLINLPKLRHLDQEKQRIFERNKLNQQEQRLITPQFIKIRNQLIDRFEKDLQLFTQTSFNFKFPQSKFPEPQNNSYSQINYRSRGSNQQINVFQDRLSDEQLQQMKVNGQFKVKSTEDGKGIPHVWKINDCLLKGRDNRLNIWEDGLAWCYGFIIQAKQFFIDTVPSSFLKIVKTPIRIFSLFFGKKKLSLIYSTDLERQIYKQFWTDILNSQLKDTKQQIGHEFLQTLYLQYESLIYKKIRSEDNLEIAQFEKIREQAKSKYYQKKTKIDNYKNKIKEIQNNFDEHWKKIRKGVYTKIQNQIPEQYKQLTQLKQSGSLQISSRKLLLPDKNSSKVVERINEQKFHIYTAYLQQNLSKQIPSITKNIIQALISIVTIVNVIQTKVRQKDYILQLEAQKIRSQIKRQHSIRSRNPTFVYSTFNQAYQPIKKTIQTQFFQNLIKLVCQNKLVNQQYKSIFRKYINLQNNFNRIKQQRKQSIRQIYVPNRVFESTYITLFPYQVTRKNGGYYLQKSIRLKSGTGYHFWKCGLYAMRIRSWSLNCLRFCLEICWFGRFGLRCLCGIEDFAFDETINTTSGQKFPRNRSTLIGIFLTVLQGISLSRRNFESQPDQGLFGKKCSRICNIIQCYIFRFFFLGVIGVIVLYPVGIILISSIMFIGVLTFWIYVPLAMVVTYLFNILIYQFQSSSRPNECYLRIFPLFSLLGLMLYSLLKIIAAFLFLFIIAPFVCFFVVLFLILQRVLRTITDSIMVCLVGCLGRTPRRDTNIASRISGPGMSQSHFQYIQQQDVYILVQAHLQKILANKFIEMMRKNIQKNQRKYELMQKFALRPFGLSESNIKYEKQVVRTNSQNLLNDFNKQAQKYLRKYPQNPLNVRFTQQQISLYFQNSVKIVKKFVEKNKIQDWIFDEKKAVKGDSQQLTRQIWQQIFGCGQQIFQPLQDIDNRFKLVDQANNNKDITKRSIQYVMKGLQGQVTLGKPTVSIKQSKLKFQDKDYKIDCANKVCELHEANREIYIKVDVNDLNSVLVAPRNLDELKLYDHYQQEEAQQRSKTYLQEDV